MTGKDEKANEMLIFTKWVDFIEWLLLALDKFPKKVRFTFTQRIENLALDIVEDLVEARYTTNRKAILKRANLRLEKLRVLIRIGQKMRYLSTESYRYAAKSIDEIGRMLGGWMKSSNETTRKSFRASHRFRQLDACSEEDFLRS